MDIQSSGAGDVITTFGEKSGGGCTAGFSSSWVLLFMVPLILIACLGR